MWVPFGKCVYLNVLELKGQQLRDPFSVQNALGKCWAGTFDSRPIDLERANLYLGRFSFDFGFANLPPTITPPLPNMLRLHVMLRLAPMVSLIQHMLLLAYLPMES